jgi:hypothetical protein
MPMPYWITNRGGLHSEIHHRSLSTTAEELREDLPPDLARLPDAAITEAWVAWQLLRHHRTLAEVTRLLDLDDETRALLARHFPPAERTT